VKPLMRAKAGVVTSRWVRSATVQARLQLEGGRRVDEVTLAAPPPSSLRSWGSARLTVRVSTRNCLGRSLVRQAWLAAAGDQRDLVIGVRRTPEFGAHAWLDGDAVPVEDAFEELLRLPSA
jgi:Transglutaminase-like superfamily